MQFTLLFSSLVLSTFDPHSSFRAPMCSCRLLSCVFLEFRVSIFASNNYPRKCESQMNLCLLLQYTLLPCLCMFDTFYRDVASDEMIRSAPLRLVFLSILMRGLNDWFLLLVFACYGSSDLPHLLVCSKTQKNANNVIFYLLKHNIHVSHLFQIISNNELCTTIC